MRVAWLSAQAPDRRAGGGPQRVAALMAAVAAATELHVVAPGPVDEAVRLAAASVLEIGGALDDGSGLAPWRRRVRDLRIAAGHDTREVAAHAALRAAAAPAAARLDADADVVVVEGPGFAPLARRRSGSAGWVLDVHNLASVMAAQEAALASGRRQRWLYRRDARNAARFEADLVDLFDDVVTVGPDDRAVLAAHHGRAQLSVVPNGVDAALLEGPPDVPSTSTISFVGALGTGPNRDGIVWFATDVLPLVRAVVPATLDVVGAGPPPDDVAALAALPGVTLHVDVESVAPHLAACRVSVVPLRIGSGTRLKALAAMAAGRPVVGTTEGLRGLGVVDGVHALVADTAPDLAAAVVRVLTDDGLAATIAAGGRDLAASQRWEVQGERMLAVLRARAAEGPRRQRPSASR
jgi:glycosyltransferase involved in cell wall biosynthesis